MILMKNYIFYYNHNIEKNNLLLHNYKNKEIYLLLPVIGYLVQAFFNISVIEVAPLFYISLGLLVDRKEKITKLENLLQENDITIAKFTLKPSKSDSVKLNNLIFDFSELGIGSGDIEDNVTVEVDGTELDIDFDSNSTATSGNTLIYQYDGTDVDDIEEEVEVEVRVTWLKPTSKSGSGYTSGDAVSVTLVSVNGVSKNSTYTRLVLPAIVTFDSFESDGAVTTFRVNVDDYDGEQISNLKLYTKSIGSGEGEAWTVSDRSEIEVSNQSTAEVVTKVTFDISKDANTYSVELENSDFWDYFKDTNGKTLRVGKVD